VLYRDGKKASMSTRAGDFVTLRELRTEVGNDAARFFYVLRKSDQHLDFDLDLAKSQSNDNPVYYIQYAHARICSVLEQWGEDEAALEHAIAAAHVRAGASAVAPAHGISRGDRMRPRLVTARPHLKICCLPQLL
jgi:arginyl-tRNA synthetase